MVVVRAPSNVVVSFFFLVFLKPAGEVRNDFSDDFFVRDKGKLIVLEPPWFFKATGEIYKYKLLKYIGKESVHLLVRFMEVSFLGFFKATGKINVFLITSFKVIKNCFRTN